MHGVRKSVKEFSNKRKRNQKPVARINIINIERHVSLHNFIKQNYMF